MTRTSTLYSISAMRKMGHMPDTRATVYLGNRQVGILVYQDGNTWFEYQKILSLSTLYWDRHLSLTQTDAAQQVAEFLNGSRTCFPSGRAAFAG